MMRLAFRGFAPRMLGASGRRISGGPTPVAEHPTTHFGGQIHHKI